MLDMGVGNVEKAAMGAVLGAKWTSGTQNAAARIAPKPASAGYKGRRKIPKQGKLTKVNMGARRVTAGVLRAVSTDTTRLIGASEGMARHVLMKSYVPGQGYKRAIDVGAKGLKAAKKARKSEAAERVRGMTPEQRHWDDFRAHTESLKNLKSQTDSTGQRIGQTDVRKPAGFHELQMAMGGMKGYMFREGGKKNGTSNLVVARDTPANIFNHEMTHAAPKRSSYRMFQVTNDGKRLMREEARAEMGGNYRGGYYRNPDATDTGYIEAARSESSRKIMESRYKGVMADGAFSKDNMDEFRQVQDKIGDARRARGFEPHQSRDWTKPGKQGRPKPAGKPGAIPQPQFTPDTKSRTGSDSRFARGLQIGTGTALVGYGGFKGNQYMDARRQRRAGHRAPVRKSFLEMGGMLDEIRLRDAKTGRFVAGAGILREAEHGRAHSPLSLERLRGQVVEHDE